MLFQRGISVLRVHCGLQVKNVKMLKLYTHLTIYIVGNCYSAGDSVKNMLKQARLHVGNS